MTDRPKILLADDSVTLRKIAELAFSDAGMDVFTAVDGQTAMETFVRVQPDIVLADVGLSGTTGYQICDMIKQDESTKHIPVLLMVGAFEPFDQSEAERVLADGFLMKPFNPIRDVITQIRQLLASGTEERADTVRESVSSTAADGPDDIESLYFSSYVETTRIEDVFIGDVVPPDDIGPDDELIEKATPGSITSGYFDGIIDDEGFHDPAGAADTRPSPIKTAEEPASSIYFAEEGPADPNPHNDLDTPDLSENAQMTGHFDETVSIETERRPAADIPEDVIDGIVERVLAKLTDSVVREVAREEVPRVAEKLMREALDQDVSD